MFKVKIKELSKKYTVRSISKRKVCMFRTKATRIKFINTPIPTEGMNSHWCFLITRQCPITKQSIRAFTPIRVQVKTISMTIEAKFLNIMVKRVLKTCNLQLFRFVQNLRELLSIIFPNNNPTVQLNFKIVVGVFIQNLCLKCRKTRSAS